MGIFPTRRIVDEDEHGNFIDPDTIMANSSLAPSSDNDDDVASISKPIWKNLKLKKKSSLYHQHQGYSCGVRIS